MPFLHFQMMESRTLYLVRRLCGNMNVAKVTRLTIVAQGFGMNHNRKRFCRDNHATINA